MNHLIFSACLFLTFFGLITCYKPWHSSRIVGGEKIDISQAPYQVSVQRKLLHRCGGSIINEYNVVTAASCILPRDYTVLTGTSTWYLTGDRYDVVERFIHEKYLHHDNDIIILKVDRAIKFSANVQPIKLPEQGEELPEGAMLSLTGWGNLKESDDYLPTDNLYKVTVPKVNQEACAQAYLDSLNIIITSRMMCGGETDKGMCEGDAGSPLVMNGKLFGIANLSKGCGHEKYPAVFAKVSAHRDWIDRIVKINTSN